MRYDAPVAANARKLLYRTAEVFGVGALALVATTSGDPVVQSLAVLWVFVLFFEPQP
jgi:hypothetical protein